MGLVIRQRAYPGQSCPGHYPGVVPVIVPTDPDIGLTAPGISAGLDTVSADYGARESFSGVVLDVSHASSCY